MTTRTRSSRSCIARQARTGQASIMVAAITTILMLLMANPAAAHYVAREDITEEYRDRCVWQKSEVSHGQHGNGYFMSVVHAKYDYTVFGQFYNCAAYNTRPAGYLRARANAYKTNSAGGNVEFCATTGTFKNLDESHKFKTAMEGNSSSVPCKKGYYRTRAGGGVYEFSNWHHHRIWTPKSEPHYLPA